MNGHVVQVLSWRLNEAFLVTLPILRKNVNFIKKKDFFVTIFNSCLYTASLYIFQYVLHIQRFWKIAEMYIYSCKHTGLNSITFDWHL